MKNLRIFFLSGIMFLNPACANKNINKIDQNNCALDMGNKTQIYNIGVSNLYEKYRRIIKPHYRELGALQTLNIYDDRYKIKIRFFPLSYKWVFSFSLELNSDESYEKPYIIIKMIDPHSNYFDIGIGDSKTEVLKKFSDKKREGLSVTENLITLNSTCTINNKFYEVPEADYKGEYFFYESKIYRMEFTFSPQ